MLLCIVSINNYAGKGEEEARKGDVYNTPRISSRLALSGIFIHGEGVLGVARQELGHAAMGNYWQKRRFGAKEDTRR